MQHKTEKTIKRAQQIIVIAIGALALGYLFLIEPYTDAKPFEGLIQGLFFAIIGFAAALSIVGSIFYISYKQFKKADKLPRSKTSFSFKVLLPLLIILPVISCIVLLVLIGTSGN